MKKIIWCVQNLNHIGGTETVSIKLMNLLCPYYDIHLMCTAKIEGTPSYEIDPRIHIHSLNMSPEPGILDSEFSNLWHRGKIFKFLKLTHQCLSFFVYKRDKQRKIIQNLMDKDSIYIGTALDSYLFAPKEGRVFFHWHFNAKNYLAFSNQLIFSFLRKPEKTIFLSKTDLDIALKKKKSLKNKATFIYNPIRFTPKENLETYNHKIIFAGRFALQKDPLLALNIALELHKANFPFTLNMFGTGPLENKMRDFIKENNLKEVNIITGHRLSQDDFLANDILLCTSNHEGTVLINGEANASSLPVISTHWKGAFDEVFSPGKTGIVIENRDPKEFANTIIKLLSDKDKLIKAKKEAYKDSFKFSEEEIIKKWRNLLDK